MSPAGVDGEVVFVGTRRPDETSRCDAEHSARTLAPIERKEQLAVSFAVVVLACAEIERDAWTHRAGR